MLTINWADSDTNMDRVGKNILKIYILVKAVLLTENILCYKGLPLKPPLSKRE